MGGFRDLLQRRVQEGLITRWIKDGAKDELELADVAVHREEPRLHALKGQLDDHGLRAGARVPASLRHAVRPSPPVQSYPRKTRKQRTGRS